VYVCVLNMSADVTSVLLFVPDQHNHRIQVFRLSDGSYLRSIGRPEPAHVPSKVRRAPDDGELRFPTDCLLDARYGLLYVCDRGHARVQVFCAADGLFVGSFGQRLPSTDATAELAVSSSVTSTANILRYSSSIASLLPRDPSRPLLPTSLSSSQLDPAASSASLITRRTTGTAGQPRFELDGHASMIGADSSTTFMAPTAFAKPFDAQRAEVWVCDCDAMRVLCWGAFQP
jgi:hypothetical protein